MPKTTPNAARAQQKRTLTQQTISAISGLFRKSPKVPAAPAAAPTASKPAAPADHAADAALLHKLLDMPADDERDIRLSNFAAQAASADLRWQAAQAVGGEAGWLALQKTTAPRDRRVAKWVKERLAASKAVAHSASEWHGLATGYASLLQSPALDVRHFMEQDKAFDAAHQKHAFDSEILNQVALWRSTLQTRLQAQNEAQRQAQHVLGDLKSVLAAAQSGAYTDELQAQLDVCAALRPSLAAANGVLAISRLHTEIDALLPQATVALAQAAQSASRLHAAQALVAKALHYAEQSPSTMDAATLQVLKKSWSAGFSPFTEQKTAFDAATAKAASVLDAHHAQLAQRHETSMVWLASTQAALAAALDAGQGQEAVRLASEINDQAGKTFDIKRLPAEQSAAIERLLAQARETRGLLYEGAALEREVLLSKAQALAAKPLLGKYQEQALKDITDAWKALNAKAGGGSSAHYAQFKAACDEAYAPVKTHKQAMRAVLAQGTAQRQAQIDELNALLARVDWQTVDWAAVEQLRQEARTAWRTSLPTDYKSRDALTQAHTQVMDLLNAKLQGARDAELARREALTQAATALASQPFAEQHASARLLVERYNAERIGVYLPRSTEQTAWTTFKAAIDAVYARRDSERKAEAHENAQALSDLIATKQSVLTALQVATTQHAADAKALQTALSKATADWDAPGRLPRNLGTHSGVNIDALVQNWLAAQDVAKSALGSAAKAAQSQRSALAWQLAQALDAGADSEALHAQIQQDATLKKAFATRNSAPNPAGLALAILDAEIANGAATPAPHKSARLQRQVQKLSDKLTGNAQAGQNAGFNAWLAAVVMAGSTAQEAGERLGAVQKLLD